MKLIAVFLLVLLCGAISSGQDMSVPVEIQARFLTKIISFDRNLHSRSGDTVVLGILYQRNFKYSSSAKNDLLGTLENSGNFLAGTVPVRYVLIDLQSIENLDLEIRSKHISLLYVAPLRSIDLTKIISICISNKVLSFTGVPNYVEAGILVGIDLSDESPQILINLEKAKASGVDFNSQLLKLSKIIQ